MLQNTNRQHLRGNVDMPQRCPWRTLPTGSKGLTCTDIDDQILYRARARDTVPDLPSQPTRPVSSDRSWHTSLPSASFSRHPASLSPRPAFSTHPIRPPRHNSVLCATYSRPTARHALEAQPCQMAFVQCQFRVEQVGRPSHVPKEGAWRPSGASATLGADAGHVGWAGPGRQGPGAGGLGGE